MPFRISRKESHLRVVPGDAAAALIAVGQLDERLFDATSLLEQGYDDAQRPDLPLIVQCPGRYADDRDRRGDHGPPTAQYGWRNVVRTEEGRTSLMEHGHPRLRRRTHAGCRSEQGLA